MGGNASILFIFTILGTIFMESGEQMVNVNIEKLLKKEGKSKYWLCQKMNITSRNLNRIIRGETSSISFKYIEEFCLYLNCNPGELLSIEKPSLIKN